MTRVTGGDATWSNFCMARMTPSLTPLFLSEMIPCGLRSKLPPCEFIELTITSSLMPLCVI